MVGVGLLIAMTLLGAPSGQRVAVLVGNNLGMEDELELAFAESDAERVAKVLTDLEGFEPGEVHLQLNGSADELRALLRDVAAAGATDLVFFYYSGHGSGRDLHLAGTRMPMTELRALLSRVSGRLNIAVVDACKSGALARAKGATLGPAYAIDVDHLPQVEGSIVITSSSEDELSQESDALQASYFTHHWVAGLYGRADANQDGLVTLEEAYRYAHFRTVETTIASRGGVQHPGYRYDLQGQGNVVLANLRRSTASLELHGDNRGGRYFILDPDKELVLTELTRSSGGATSVRLPPGHYRVRKREPRQSLIVDVEVAAGERVVIRDHDMQQVPLGQQVRKGGPSLIPSSHGPVITTSLRNGLIDRMHVTWQAEAGYDLTWGAFFLQPRFAFRTATIDPASLANPRLQQFEYDLGLATGVRLRFAELSVTLGGNLGLVFFDHAVIDPSPVSPVPSPPVVSGAVPVGFQGTGLTAIGYTFGPVLISLHGFAGVAAFNDQDQKLQAAFVAGGGLGAAWVFE